MPANSKRTRSSTVQISQENPWADATGRPKRTRSSTVPVAQENPWTESPSGAAPASAAPKHTRSMSTAQKQRAAVVATVQSLVPVSGRPVESSMAQYHWDSIMALQQGVRRLNREIAVSDLELRDLILRSQLTRKPGEREILRDQGNKATVELLSLQRLAAELKQIMIASLDQAKGKGPKRVSIDLDETEQEDVAAEVLSKDSKPEAPKPEMNLKPGQSLRLKQSPTPALSETSGSASVDNEDTLSAAPAWSRSSGHATPDVKDSPAGPVKSPYPSERSEGLAWLWDEPELVPKPLSLKAGLKDRQASSGTVKADAPKSPTSTQSRAESHDRQTLSSSSSVRALKPNLSRDESQGRQTLSSGSSVLGLQRIESRDESLGRQTLSSASSTRGPKYADSRDESRVRQELGSITDIEEELTKITSIQSVATTSTSSQSQPQSQASHPSSEAGPGASRKEKVVASLLAATKPKSFTHRLQSSSSIATATMNSKNASVKVYQLYRLKKTGANWAEPEVVPVNIPQKEIEQKIRIGLKNTAGLGFVTVAQQLEGMRPKRRRCVERLLGELNGENTEGGEGGEAREGGGGGGWQVACVEETHVVITARETRDVRVMEVIFEKAPRSKWTGEVVGGKEKGQVGKTVDKVDEVEEEREHGAT